MGFIVYQLGIFAAEEPTGSLGGVANALFALFSSGGSPGLSAVVLKFAGGIMAIIGLMMVINGFATSGEVYAKDLQTLQSSVQELESKINLAQLSNLTQPQKQQVDCRFCGVKIDKDELFCPACKKAQK